MTLLALRPACDEILFPEVVDLSIEQPAWGQVALST